MCYHRTSQWRTQGIHWTTIKVDKCQGWQKVQCLVNKKQPAVNCVPQHHAEVMSWPDLSQAQPPCLAHLHRQCPWHNQPLGALGDAQFLLRSWPIPWSGVGQLSSKFPCLWPLFPCWDIFYEWNLKLPLCGWRRWMFCSPVPPTGTFLTSLLGNWWTWLYPLCSTVCAREWWYF